MKLLPPKPLSAILAAAIGPEKEISFHLRQKPTTKRHSIRSLRKESEVPP